MSKPSILVSKGVILKSFYLLKDKRQLLYPFIKLHSWFDAWYNSSQLLKSYLKHPLMTIKIISAIHFEAFKLWVKGIKIIKKKIKIRNNLTVEN